MIVLQACTNLFAASSLLKEQSHSISLEGATDSATSLLHFRPQTNNTFTYTLFLLSSLIPQPHALLPALTSNIQHEVHYCRYCLSCCQPRSRRRIEREGPWFVDSIRRNLNVRMLTILSQRSLADHGQCLLSLGLADRWFSAEPGSC